jgi:anion-transporting  ArsA/GET3 family ATPase
LDLEHLVRTKKVLVCVGSGGVGKTTTAAAIALKAAELGLTVCVLTIDPARRLADAMGVASLSNVATRVEPASFEAAGLPVPPGPLWALMLDTKRTWDDLVTRYAADAEQAERILNNHYYQQISSALTGSQEFMAMEKLYELHDSGTYDLLVLDTPPARHALDFLDAPKKMMGFMDENVLKAFLAPGALGLSLFQSSSAWMLGVLQRLTGFEVLRDIADFVASFSGMHAGFRDRASQVEALLRANRSAFLLVASPSPQAIDEASHFHRRLVDSHMPVGGFIVNRVYGEVLGEPGAKTAWDAMRGDPARLLPGLDLPAGSDLAVRVAENLERFEVLGRRDRVQIDRLERACPTARLRRTIPAFDVDVHDLAGLTKINRHLFPADGSSDERP